MSQVSISGAVSGLDTAGIINQLVAVQTNQQSLLRAQQAGVQTKADAYASLVTSLTSLGNLAADLAKTGSWTGATATSSSSAVTTTATGTTAGSMTFDVLSVASAHSVISLSTVAATTDVVADGPVTVTSSDGTSFDLAVGAGTLDDVVSAVNSSGKGLVAAAIRTAPGEYRLQVTATSTGVSSEFSLSGLTGFAGTDVLNQATDATVHVGSNPATAYDITSSTNSFSGLMPGVSFTVSKVENAVTINTKVDGSAIADKVGKLVDTANNILADIASKTAYDVKTRKGGPFTGESTVRTLQQNILSTVSGQSAPGVQLTRSGRLTFDRTAFLSAFATDPAGAARAFGSTATFTPADGVTSTTVTLSNALKTARAGTYAVTVTSAPGDENVQGTIDGQVATGLGSVLSLPTGTSGAVGLSFVVSATQNDLAASGGAIGSVRYTPGLAQRLVTLTNAAAASTGSVTTAKASATSEVKRFQGTIDAWDLRLTAYRQTLSRQFTAMETAMQRLKSSTSALSSMINTASSSSNSSSGSNSS